MNKTERDMRHKGNAPKPDIEFVATEPCGLLEFLLLKFPGKSRNHVKALLTHRQVSVDGIVVTQYDTVVREGQTVKISRTGGQIIKEKSPLDILYEDNDLIVINKPAGLLSIASDKDSEHTAYRMLTDYVKTKDPENRIYAVHRLDRDTSGILMVAKNERMKLALQDNWSDLVSERGYVAVVEGQLQEKNGRIQSWLKETKTLMMYSSFTPGDGLEAITNYRVINENNDYSLVDIRLETGRKNQIRVHMKDIGHNVVGDKKYGAKTDPLRRLGLHAYKLAFTHPFTNKTICFETRLPKSFMALVKSNEPRNGR